MNPLKSLLSMLLNFNLQTLNTQNYIKHERIFEKKTSKCLTLNHLKTITRINKQNSFDLKVCKLIT